MVTKSWVRSSAVQSTEHEKTSACYLSSRKRYPSILGPGKQEFWDEWAPGLHLIHSRHSGSLQGNNHSSVWWGSDESSRQNHSIPLLCSTTCPDRAWVSKVKSKALDPYMQFFRQDCCMFIHVCKKKKNACGKEATTTACKRVVSNWSTPTRLALPAEMV